MERSQKFLSIRHAESEFNYTRATSTDRISPFYNKDLIDCSITKNGQTQADLASKQVKLLPISMVFVSPLRRALETARILFENHQDKPKIYVVPFLRERVSASCDLSNFIDQPLKDFEDFDWSYMLKAYEGQKNYWLAEELSNNEMVNQIKIKENTNAEQQKFDILELIKKLIHDENNKGLKTVKLESVKEFNKSIDKLVGFLKKIKEDQSNGGDKIIAVVCHFGTIKQLIKRMTKESEHPNFSCKNCEIKEFLL